VIIGSPASNDRNTREIAKTMPVKTVLNLTTFLKLLTEQTEFNPLDVLPQELVRDIVSSVIQDLVGTLNRQFKHSIEDQRARILAKLNAAEQAAAEKSDPMKRIGSIVKDNGLGAIKSK
jgi:hypothetical protein